jgi:hypothetical protein
MRARRIVVVAALLAVTAGMSWSARADDTTEPARPDGVISANVESYAARVEYDIPLPAGSGTVGQVVGEIRASAAGENAKGLAASPSALDAVVGGKFSDPQGTGHPANQYPQTECFYPGALVDTAFAFPTDERKETSGAPPIGYATAQCGAGPTLDLRAHLGGDKTAAAGPTLTAASTTSEALARPVKGVLEATTSSRAADLSILNGAITVGGVDVRGHSQITGRPGEGASTASVALTDINAAGVLFSLASTSNNGAQSVQLTSAGQTMSLDTAPARGVIDAANAALKPTGCTLGVLSSPDRYPQGFLFARPEPDIGVTDDGNSAGSYRGGLLIRCDIPRSISEPSTFNPQRAQILLGFAYTGTSRKPGDDNFSIGGFDTGDLVGSAQSPALANLLVSSPLPAVAAPAAAPPPAAVAPATERAAAHPAGPALIYPRHLAASTKWILGLVSLVLWVPLTNAGVRRLRLALFDGAEA